MMVFQQQRRTSKQVLDGVVLAMKIVRKWRRWEEMKNVEQWCFSIGKNDERLLVTVFQQRKRKNEKLLVVATEGRKAKQVLDGVVSVMENDEETMDWSVFGNGKK
jgi:hypothetical protein